MAGSTTQSLDNFTAQGMERHQIMMNSEVMKHFRLMNRASVREIMLQHEKTFKEQVHDLHKLYEVQRLLMEKAKSRGMDGYAGAPPPPRAPSPSPPLGSGNALSEETNQLRQGGNFWEQIAPDSMAGVKAAMATRPLPSTEKAIPEKNTKFEESVKNSNSPVRKRKIDLEQLPEDDSEDEIETSVDVLSSSLSGNSREFTYGHSGMDSMIKSHLSASASTGLKTLQPAKESQASGLPTGEYKNHVDGSGGSSFYLFQHGTTPSLPANIMKTEQNLSSIGDGNVTYQNAFTINTGVGTIKSNTMFLPQADLIDRASQDAGKDAHWFFQATEANMANRALKSPPQQPQRLSPQVALPELLPGRSHPHNGVLQGSPNLEQRHHSNRSPPFGSVSAADWSKVTVEKQPPGLPMGLQKDGPFSLPERLGDASRWLIKEPLSQGPLASVVPMARIETRASEGGPPMPGVVAPTITVSAGKGLNQERDLNLWPSQNPILQLPQYQQPSIFPSQVFSSVNQGVWLQPSQTSQNSLYSQQMVYGVHSSDSSQIGYRNESLQRNPGEIAGPWNMIGLGHYYSSVPSTPQKPPFKKPPKLILKTDGVGTDYKLVPPEKDISEKASQKKPTNSCKKDTVLDISKLLEKKSIVQKEVKDEDLKLDRRASVGAQVSGSVGQGREPSKTSGVPLEPKLLATAAASLTQEIIAPKDSSLLHDATATLAVSSVTQHNVGAAAGTTHGVFAAGLIVSASLDKHKSQSNVSRPENVLPSQGQDKISAKNLHSPENTEVACLKETPLLTNSSIDKDMEDRKAESSLLQCKDDLGASHCISKDSKAPSAKAPISESNATDTVAASQPESLSAASENAVPKFQEENALVANACPKRPQKLDADLCKEFDKPKGGHLTPCASTDSPSKDASHNKGLFEGRSVGPSADLANPSRQPLMQTASIQSTSTNTPATPTSERACSSTRSSSSLVPESKEDANIGVSSEDLHLDFDNDNLAASILLSFAPKPDPSSEEMHSKSDACAVSSSGRKDRPADQASSSSRKERRTDQESRKTLQIAEGATVIHMQTSNSGASQGRKLQTQGSLKRTDRMDHPGPAKSTTKDRLRTDRWNVDELETDNGGEDTIKSLTIKLPRVAGSLNGGTMPISRSKQLSKLNGVTLSGDSRDHAKTFKANDTFHAPTGRRSSRGPPTAARVLHNSGSRVHQQTRHRLEGSMNAAEKDSGSREEAGVLRSKADGNMKSKAWGELNKTRSHPRKQFQETSHRKTQR